MAPHQGIVRKLRPIYVSLEVKVAECSTEEKFVKFVKDRNMFCSLQEQVRYLKVLLVLGTVLDHTKLKKVSVYFN